MEDEQYNKQIEQIANMLQNDNVSYDEQDQHKLEKYRKHAQLKFDLDDDKAMTLVYESLLYLKLQNSESVDPLQEGEKFGAGFS